ncbi:MAG: DUF2079 domain-containing protein [Myxococcota bacterium]|nr:DUF2079 domain-containing protein [Myxococcota bacterium]
MCAFWGLAAALACRRAQEFAQPLGLDNAYFLQRTWQAAFLDAPQRTLLATETGEGLIAGRHFEPILALLVPLVRAAPSMETLLLFQVGLMGLGGLGAYRLSRALGLDRLVSVLLCWTWLALPGVWAMGTLDFRTFSLAAPLVVCALAALLESRLLAGALLLLLASACREEVAILSLMAAPALAWRTRSENDFKPAWVVIAIGLAWTTLVVAIHAEQWGFIQPGELAIQAVESLGGPGAPRAFEMLYAQVGISLGLVLAAPLVSLGVLMTWLSAAAMQALLNTTAAHVFAVAVALMAWVHGASLVRLRTALVSRLPTRADQATELLAAALFLCTVTSNPHISMPTPIQEPEVWDLIDQVPPAGAVLTTSRLAPALAARPEIYVFEDWGNEHKAQKMLQQVEWAVLPEDNAWVQQLEANGFTLESSAGGFSLFESPIKHSPAGHLTPR